MREGDIIYCIKDYFYLTRFKKLSIDVGKPYEIYRILSKGIFIYNNIGGVLYIKNELIESHFDTISKHRKKIIKTFYN